MKKKTFLKDDPGKKHLRIVISDPDPDDNVLVVSVNTFDENKRNDTSCILNKGDHEFIKHKSYINYYKSEEYNYWKINYQEMKGLIIPKEEISDILLHDIQEGAKKSRLLPGKFRKFFGYF